MENRVHLVNYGDEARLHYLKKIKGEMIERVEESRRYGAKTDVLRDIVQFLDNAIYDTEEKMQTHKRNEREGKEIKRSHYDY